MLDQEAYSSELDDIWKNLICTSYFYDTKDLLGTSDSPGKDAIMVAAGLCQTVPKTHIHEATSAGHSCPFLQSPVGGDFYFSIMALLVPYFELDFDWDKVIACAGIHALRSLDRIMDLRKFEQSPPDQKCSYLACLFYALITILRMEDRCVRLIWTSLLLWSC